MGGLAVHVKVGAVPSSVNVDWVLAAVFGNTTDYGWLNVEVIDTMFCWGCGSEAGAQVEEGELEAVSIIIEVESEKKLYVVMRGRVPHTHWCFLRGKVKKRGRQVQ